MPPIWPCDGRVRYHAPMNRVPIVLMLLLLPGLALSCGKKNNGEANNVYLVNSDPNEGGPPVGDDGSACSSDRRCDGGVCLTSGQGWDGGYCTTEQCVENGCNGEAAECISFLDGTSFCLDSCEANTDCRRDYRCRQLDATGRRVCYPDGGDGPRAGSIGDACASAADCVDGLMCDESRPGGYCLRSDCSGTCPEGAACVDWDGELRCVQACEQTRDCRVGYICDPLDDELVCVPSEAIEPPFDFSVTEGVLGIQCSAEQIRVEESGTRWTIEYDVPAETTSYILVPHVASGSFRPISITTPSGQVIDLVDDYIHHNIRVTEFQFFDQESQGINGNIAMDWPIQIPFAPQHRDLVEAGTHTLEIVASTSDPCLYVVPSSSEGATIDLDVYGWVGPERDR